MCCLLPLELFADQPTCWNRVFGVVLDKDLLLLEETGATKDCDHHAVTRVSLLESHIILSLSALPSIRLGWYSLTKYSRVKITLRSNA
jgi:hypothetical protein